MRFDKDNVDVRQQLIQAKSKAGLSWSDVSKMIPYLNINWCYDLESSEYEVTCTLDLPVLFTLLHILKTSPKELFGHLEIDSEIDGNPCELIASLKNMMSRKNVPIAKVEYVIGWEMVSILRCPQNLMYRNLDFLFEVCEYVKWNWLSCLCQWYRQWDGGCGWIKMDNCADDLNIYQFSEKVLGVVSDIIRYKFAGLATGMNTLPPMICLSRSQVTELCKAIEIKIKESHHGEGRMQALLRQALEILSLNQSMDDN